MSTPATVSRAARDLIHPAAPVRRPGTATVVRWEMTKLAAQARSRFLLLGCLIGPPVIVLVLNGQQTPPSDTIFGRQIHLSGFAVPLLILAFAAQWVFPLLASLVAGDIFANEDQHGTWKTILTRSVSRTQIFAAKTITAISYNILVLVVLAASTIAASMLIVGRQPLTGLTGQLITPATALRLDIAAWATALAPMVGFTALAIALSVATRNPTVGVVAPVVLGLAMQLVSAIGGLNHARRWLLSTPLETWHGLLTQQPFYGPLTTSIEVSAAWTLICLVLAYLSLRRRDITEG